MRNRRFSAWGLPVFALLLGSCGGGGGANSASFDATAPAPQQVGVPPLLTGFFGLPDALAIKGESNSGVFLDLISDPSRSESIKQPSHYTIIVPPGKTNLRVFVFDGNCEGLWDQNQVSYGAGGVLVANGSALEYRLSTDGSGASQQVALGESPRAAQGVGVTKVLNQDDDWEALFDGPLPGAASALRPDGSHRYALDVKYVVDANDAINGFKLAVDGRIQITPSAGAATVIGGFIGGVVDSREMHFSPAPDPLFPNLTYAVSRDFYPNLLTPTQAFSDSCTDAASFKPAILHPAPNAFTNTYNGTFDVPIDLIPDFASGQTWANFVANLILEEGDADDVIDALPAAPAGTQTPGIPADDGQPYPIGNPTRNNAGYRLPVAAAPSIAGTPWLEVVDPAGNVVATRRDLSGNVNQAPAGGTGGTQGWEQIPIPSNYVFDPANVTWKLRMHNLDARNTWFVRSNVKRFDTPTGEIGDRVWVDKLNECDGVQGPVGAGASDEHGVNGVSVTLYQDVAGVLTPVVPPAGATWTNPQLTRDLPGGGAFDSPAGVFGNPGYYLFDVLAIPVAGVTYVVKVDDSNFLAGGPLSGYTRTFPATDSGTTTLTLNPIKNSDHSLDFGYCKREAPGSIGDRVWVDALNICNGIEDATTPGATGEHGVNGVSVTLFSNTGGVLSAVTPPVGATWTNPQLTHDLPVGEAFQSPAGIFGNAGFYLFDKLPAPGAGASYAVQVDASNFLAGGPLFGYARTFPAAVPATTTLDQTKLDDRSLDFGYCKTEKPGSIGDRVWVDALNICNGIEDTTTPGATGEHGVNGVSVTLFLNTGGVLSAVTPPVGATWTNPQLTHDLPVGEAFQSPAGIFGNAGFYLFDKLPAPGAGASYAVQVDALNFLAGGPLFGYARTFPAAVPATTTLDQTKLDDRSLDFGYCKTEKPGSIGDRVWADALNICNGIEDTTTPGATGEHGVNGVSVTLFSNTGGVLSAVTPPAGATWTNPQLTHDLPVGEAFQSPAGIFGNAGFYLFDKLPAPGAGASYAVQVDASNFLAGGPLFGYARTFPAAVPATTTLDQTKLDDRSLDFGYCKTEKPGSIGDRVWADALNICNGIEDTTTPGATGEHGVNGVSVTLFSNTGGVLSAVTPPAGATWTNPQLTHDLPVGEAFQSPAGIFGNAGFYLFDKLPAPGAGASYAVQVDASNFAAGGPLFGYARTFPAAVPATTTLDQTKLDDRSLDFGYCKTEKPGSIGDRVWADALNICNGIEDTTTPGATGEHGVNGVSVTLFSNTGGVLSAVTPPAGATWTNPQLTHDLPVGEAFQSPAGIFGNAGFYLFDKLPVPGAGASYAVQVDASNFAAGGPLFGYARTFPAAVPATTTLDQTKLDDRSLDFGYCKTEKPGSIGDRVWADALNICNGIEDTTTPGATGEHGVNGVSVTLFLDTGGVLSAVTPPAGATWTNPQLTHDLPVGEAFQSPAGIFGNAGFYLFDKLPAPGAGASYAVQVDASNFLAGGPLFGYARTFPAAVPATTTLDQTNLDDRSLDFGYCKTEKPGSIGDRVWADALNICNGIEDTTTPGATGEHGVNGVSVTLFLDTGGVLSAVTPPTGATWTNPQLTRDLPVGEAFQSPAGIFGNAGFYLFDKLPAPGAGASYVVQVDASNFAAGGPLFGYTRTFPAAVPATTTLDQTKLDDRSLDFGYCKKLGRLGDRVWQEQDCDGIQETNTGESGIPNVRINLWVIDGTGVRVAPPAPTPAFTLTNADGIYAFEDLPEANYEVEIDPTTIPAGLTRTSPATNVWSKSLAPGEIDLTLDFGYCQKSCECQSGKVHELRLDARVWLADPSPSSLDVYVKLDRGCPDCKTNTSTMADLADFAMGRQFPGEQHGRNGLITVTDVKVIDGYAHVYVTLSAKCPYFPEGYFDGDIRIEVTVNGVGEAVCAPVDCHCLKPEGVFPCDWKPRWCDDLPAFRVSSYVPWECVPHEECKPPCKPPPCEPPPCKEKPTCEKPSCEKPSCEKPVCSKPSTCDPKPKCPPPVVCETKPGDKSDGHDDKKKRKS